MSRSVQVVWTCSRIWQQNHTLSHYSQIFFVDPQHGQCKQYIFETGMVLLPLNQYGSQTPNSKFQIPPDRVIGRHRFVLRFAAFSSSWTCLDAIFLSGAWWHRQQQALLDPAGRGQKYTYCEVTPLVSNLLILLLHLLLFLLLGPGKLSLPMFVGDLSKNLWRIRHCLMQGRWIFWCFRRRPPPAYGGRESNIRVFDCVLTHVYIYIYV